MWKNGGLAGELIGGAGDRVERGVRRQIKVAAVAVDESGVVKSFSGGVLEKLNRRSAI